MSSWRITPSTPSEHVLILRPVSKRDEKQPLCYASSVMVTLTLAFCNKSEQPDSAKTQKRHSDYRGTRDTMSQGPVPYVPSV